MAARSTSAGRQVVVRWLHLWKCLRSCHCHLGWGKVLEKFRIWYNTYNLYNIYLSYNFYIVDIESDLFRNLPIRSQWRNSVSQLVNRSFQIVQKQAEFGCCENTRCNITLVTPEPCSRLLLSGWLLLSPADKTRRPISVEQWGERNVGREAVYDVILLLPAAVAADEKKRQPDSRWRNWRTWRFRLMMHASRD